MTFSETDVVRDAAGKFSEKTGSAPDISVTPPKKTYIYRVEGDDHETEDVEASSEEEALNIAAELFEERYSGDEEDDDDDSEPTDVRDLLFVKAVYEGDINDYDDEWTKVTPGKHFHDPNYEHVAGRYAGYEVKNYRKLPIGMEGGAFTASIWRDGKRVMLVENAGNGGANTYTDLSSPKTPLRHRGEEIDRFKKTASAMYGPDKYESDDALFAFVQLGSEVDRLARINGWSRTETAEAMAEDYEKQMAEFGSKADEVELAALRDPSIISRLTD
jgi:hypothetical protein